MCPTSQNFEPGVLLTRCVINARRLEQSCVFVGQADGSVIIRKKALLNPRAYGGPDGVTTYYY